MSLSPGTKIGSFEITGSLGAGGMGEVYRALDTRLRREVAVKVLPEAATWDRERIGRFEREAQMLASLNHPNIGAIYGLEESDGLRCLILELIQGETIAEKIARTPMPVDQALGVALQIAEALEAAHDRGIIHRDLKPANVMVTPEGGVKVLDFGLAKAYGGDGGHSSTDISLSPTMTAAATQAGMILGTASYMSPEQAAGQAVDRRADIWAFGVVLLEMLTGRKTFGGETVSHTLASVLKEDPDWSRLPADLPPGIRALLERCLVKKVRRRLQSIGEARVILEDYRDDPASFAPAPPERAAPVPAARRTGLLPWSVAALGLLAALGAPWWAPAITGSHGVPAGPTRLVIAGPTGESLFRGYGSSAVISPDGTRVAYVTETNDNRKLYVQYLDQWTGTVIAEGPGSTSGPYHPFWSPDGQWLGFVTRSEMKKVPVRGGSPITLCAVERNRGATWGPDGTIVFAPSPGSPLFRVSASGGDPEALTTLDEARGEKSHRWPEFLPGGKALLFTTQSGDDDFDHARIEVVDLSTGERHLLVEGGSEARYVPTGHVVYFRAGTLFAFPFDPVSLKVTGSVAPAVERVSGEKTQGGAQYSVSGNGTLVYALGAAGGPTTTLVKVDLEGAARPVWEAPMDFGGMALSPDGTQLAVEVDAEGNQDIWVLDMARQVPTRITFAEGDDSTPIWSPDGAFIYFASDRDGSSRIYRTASDGSGEAELVLEEDKPVYPVDVSPDGRRMTYLRDLVGQVDILILPLDGGDPEPFATSPAIEYGARFSPNGRWIVYGSAEAGAWDVYVRPASGGRGGKWQISRNGGGYPHWSHDGRAIYYRNLSTGGVYEAAVEAEETFRAGSIRTLFEGPYLVRADGTDNFDVLGEGGFVMVQGPGDTGETHEHLQVVLGWSEDLRRTLDPAGPAR